MVEHSERIRGGEEISLTRDDLTTFQTSIVDGASAGGIATCMLIR